MSTTENTSVEPNEDDLDSFAADFFGQKEAAPEPASSEEESETEEESDANEDTQNTETDTLETETDDVDEEDTEDTDDTDEDEDESSDEDEPEEKPKKPKSRFQERIDEVVAKQREAERERDAERADRLELERKLAELQQKNEKTTEPSPTESQGPTPDDKNEDGTEKYPLGEFDPSYIRDLTKYTIQQERDAIKAAEQQEQSKRAEEAQRQALEQGWQEKLGGAQERYPDFQEKSENLIDSFSGLEPAYGEYLAATIMGMDHGPDVLYYLANNPDEATKIAQSGPTKATIALGRLEAKFVEAEAEKTMARPKTSKAPNPPSTRLKGSSAVVPEVPDDTDDLEAFERKLFKKR